MRKTGAEKPPLTLVDLPTVIDAPARKFGERSQAASSCSHTRHRTICWSSSAIVPTVPLPAK
jgi:hypothetical protein